MSTDNWISTRVTPEALAAATGIEGFVPCEADTAIHAVGQGKAVFVGVVEDLTVLSGAWVGAGDRPAIEQRARDLSKVVGELAMHVCKPDERLFLFILARDGEVDVKVCTPNDQWRVAAASGYAPDMQEEAGLAAPEPTLSLTDVFVRKDVRVQTTLPDRCPGCGDRYVHRWTRPALPWESFVSSTTFNCDCVPKIEVQVVPEPTQAPRAYPRAWEDWGYKSSWLATSAAPEDIMRALGLEGWQRCTWKAGVRGALDGLAVFVSAPIDGWVFVLGDTIDEGNAHQRERRVVDLSVAVDGVVQLHVSQRILGRYQYVMATRGVAEPIAMPDEDDVIAIATARSVNPLTFSGRREEAPMGWAVPEPLPPGMRSRPTRPVPQRPAASRDEAIMHASRVVHGCPSCGSTSTALYLPGREGLPWEAHVLAIALHCSGCDTNHALQYPPGPTYFDPPDPSELRISTSDAPSALITTEDWRRILQQERENHDDMPQRGYPPDLEAEELERTARNIALAAHELAKVDRQRSGT